MGTDIQGIIAHDLDFPPPESLPSTIAATIGRLSPFISDKWSWDASYQHHPALRLLRNEGGPNLYICRRSIVITTGHGWDQAADDPKFREWIFSATSTIAHFFGSSQLVLLPDDIEPWCDITDKALYDGQSFEEALQALSRFARPSKNFRDAIKGRPDWKVDGYLVLKIRLASSASDRVEI